MKTPKTVQFQKFIHEIRGQKVMLDADLAVFYGIPVKRLNEAVKRNSERFPEDFMFQLNKTEWDFFRSQFVTFSETEDDLRSQIATFNGTVSRKYLPYVFTEHGVAMLSSVLNSPNAIKMNIAIIRTFTAMRRYFATTKDLGKDLKNLEKVLMLHIDDTNLHLEKHTKSINDIIVALNGLMKQPKPLPKRKIGFR